MYEFEISYFDEECRKTEEDYFLEELNGMIQYDKGVWYV